MLPFLLRNVLKQLLLRHACVAHHRIQSAKIAYRLPRRTSDRTLIRQVGTKRQRTGLFRQRARGCAAGAVGEGHIPARIGKYLHTRGANTT